MDLWKLSILNDALKSSAILLITSLSESGKVNLHS